MSPNHKLTTKDKAIGYSSFIIILIGLGLIFLRVPLGSHVPGSFYESTDYTEQLMVMVFETNSSSKNYLVPADVTRDYDSGYSVSSIYWPNGGVSNTDSNMCGSLSIEYRASCRITDDSGNETQYYIQLTDKQP
ncbi:MAG: hypothetical protein V4611_04250 [Patescibacteria group bacterium]